MNILIAGGAGPFMNNLLIKLRKEGHRVSVLTGNRFAEKSDYSKMFEIYKYDYDANCLNEIVDSVSPDVTIFMGAFDTNFKWKHEETDSVHFASSLANLLMSYTMKGKGRFIYLSSDEVFSDLVSSEPFTEKSEPSPNGFKAIALSQGEQLCESYRRNQNLDIITLRLDHLYGVPRVRKDIYDIVSRFALSCLEDKNINYNKNSKISLLYEKDAIEEIYKVVSAIEHKDDVYHISSGVVITEEELGEKIRERMDSECLMSASFAKGNLARTLSNERFSEEFGSTYVTNVDKVIDEIATHMQKNAYAFVNEEQVDLPLIQRIKKNAGWFFGAIFPFIENLVVFFIAFWIYRQTFSNDYFAMLDILLLYVLLFAIIHGQQQATFAALLAVVGYYLNSTADRSSFEFFLDANTYVWIAQLFIVGLSVGYLRDSITKLKDEADEEQKFVETQLEDIENINSTNVRIKDSLETQIVNQSDSIGKIYSITSALDSYAAEEVLFYAADIVGQLMKSNDVAIYSVSNGDYARLFSATSDKARMMGASVKYTGLGDMYEDIKQRKVFVNRKMDSSLPLMANAIYEEDNMQIIIMVWGLSWENMTLSQANQLSIVSSLIQNAVLRANRYLEALEDKRYVDGTSMLEKDSFRALLNAYLKAEGKGLTTCTVVRIKKSGETVEAIADVVKGSLRNSDYYGTLDDGAVYALLSNTKAEDAHFVVDRFISQGFVAEVCEGVA